MQSYKEGDSVRVTRLIGLDGDKYGICIGDIYKIKSVYGSGAVEVSLNNGIVRLLLTGQFEAIPNMSLNDPHYILQYELDIDPFELFDTKKEVEARVQELSKDTALKRDRLVVYEIAKTYKLKLETQVIFELETAKK